jgi:rod shape-determining protein MreD
MGIQKLTFYQYVPSMCLILGVFFSVLTGMSAFAYLNIFYWCVFRPDLVPVLLLFSLGIFHDCFNSHYLGEETFVYLILMFILYMDRRFLLHRDFIYLWKNISIILSIIFLRKLGVVCHLDLSFFLLNEVFNLLLGCVSFPLFVRLITTLHNRFAIL